MNKFCQIVKRVTNISKYNGVIKMPKFIVREKLPNQYTEEDYINDNKTLNNIINHPYIVFKNSK